MKDRSILFSIFLIIFFGCTTNNNKTTTNTTTMSDTSLKKYSLPDTSKFNDSIDGKSTHLFVIKNSKGMSAAITNYGGRIVSLTVPDKNGKPTDVVVGFSSVKDYVSSTEPYFGATIGRYGNRIAKGKFTLDGKAYSLFINNPPNTLHGGKKGFQAVVWDALQPNDSTLELTYLSKDGEENFPGNLKVKVKFDIANDNGLHITYDATTDKKTVINLTNHAFFNLNGEGSGTILNHQLQIFADKYTPVDSTLIPTGKIEAVKLTPFDFTDPQSIGSRIESKNDQLKYGKGYDHNFVLNSNESNKIHPAAKVTGDRSGIVMEVATMEPGLQLYSGNFMQSKNTFKGGAKDDFRTAFCLETQHFPDSPNQPSFPSTILNAGQQYHTETLYSFSIVK